MKRKSFLLILLFVFFISLMGEGYKIGKGDVLNIDVLGESDFSGNFTVNEKGCITLKYIGDFKVEGLTLEELKKKLYDVLNRDYINNPTIKVKIVEYKSKKIIVLGEVNHPGEYYLKKNRVSILEVISMTGGLTEKCGDVAIVFRKKSDNNEFKKIEIKIGELLSGKGKPDKAYIYPDDIVNFPRKVEDNPNLKVYIEGKVIKPGAYKYRRGMTVYQLCIEAGGFAEFSAENRAYIIRTVNGKTKKIKVNLKKVRSGKARDIKLKPGDRVIIPSSWF